VKNSRKVFSQFTDDKASSGNIVIYLPGKSLQENDDTIKAYTEKFNASGPVVFLLTGENNSALDEHKRARRDTASKDTNEAKKITVLTHSPNGVPCLIVATSGATVTLLKKESKAEPEVTKFEKPTIISGETKCLDETGGSRAEKVTLKLDSATAGGSALTITWDVTTNGTSEWDITPSKVLVGSTDYPVSNKQAFFSSKLFSYSCQNQNIKLNVTGGKCFLAC